VRAAIACALLRRHRPGVERLQVRLLGRRAELMLNDP
jgi:hypothetical protein